MFKNRTPRSRGGPLRTSREYMRITMYRLGVGRFLTIVPNG